MEQKSLLKKDRVAQRGHGGCYGVAARVNTTLFPVHGLELLQSPARRHLLHCGLKSRSRSGEGVKHRVDGRWPPWVPFHRFLYLNSARSRWRVFLTPLTGDRLAEVGCDAHNLVPNPAKWPEASEGRAVRWRTMVHLGSPFWILNPFSANVVMSRGTRGVHEGSHIRTVRR